MYKQTIRPVLFLMEPEKVHALLVSCLKCYRHLPWCRCWIRHLYTCSDKQLIWNHLTFRNRIGLSAGFDKGAEIFDELARLWFRIYRSRYCNSRFSGWKSPSAYFSLASV